MNDRTIGIEVLEYFVMLIRGGSSRPLPGQSSESRMSWTAIAASCEKSRRCFFGNQIILYIHKINYIRHIRGHRYLVGVGGHHY